ncbi:MAG: hypothetical protein NTY53_14350, partial [Kiritimatiellaeota bacterium]|nr:hypothetical protein [Kiritimatiellota bacterium]
AGLLLPAVIGGIKKADITQAQTECKLIAAAMNAYRSDYGKWPAEYPGRATSKAAYWDYADVISTLRGSNKTGTVQDQLGLSGNNWANQNPKQRIYLQVSERSIVTNTSGTAGTYSGSIAANDYPYAATAGMLADPWGNKYVVLPDWDMDGEIKGADGETSIRASVAVWSWGPNPTPGPNGTLESPTNTTHIRSWR